MNPNNEPQKTPRSDRPEKPAQTPQGQGATPPKPNASLPRFDDRPERAKTDNTQTPAKRPTPGEAPRTTGEPVTPGGDEPATTGPRYGDRESDDPRRSSVEASEGVEESDKSGR